MYNKEIESGIKFYYNSEYGFFIFDLYGGLIE